MVYTGTLSQIFIEKKKDYLEPNCMTNSKMALRFIKPCDYCFDQ